MLPSWPQNLTNREIAQGLFVTSRTVEGHLTSVFRKLRLASRDELPAALAGDAPPSRRPAPRPGGDPGAKGLSRAHDVVPMTGKELEP